jgi:pyruvate/2-oxoglutarate dehydrogenase complex dihydrolipoamide acyltransferase (E2) component
MWMAEHRISIPKLAVTMAEGTLSGWLVEDGVRVVAGQTLYSLETEKVETDIEAPVSGVLHQSGVAGETYAVGDEIGTIVVDD